MSVRVKDVEKIWLSNAEAQKYLGMSDKFLYALRAEGELRFHKLRGAIFYRKTDIDRLLEKSRVI